VELEEHPHIIALLNEYYQGHINEASRRMAMLPAGAELIFEEDVRFPLTTMRNVYIFPGVPELLRAKFDAIKERFRDSPYHLVQIFTHEGESVLAEHLEATLEHFPGIEIGSYPRYDTGEYKVMLTLESKDPALLGRARDHLLTCMAADQLVRVVG
jgi:molybdopterin-biosynthesis enzyme MoeA-like protein